MREKLLEYQEETNNMYNGEATPCEGSSHDLAKNDLARYPDIITSGTLEAPYYTNSTNLPLGLDRPIGFYLSHQSKLQPLYTGGTVFHFWNGEAISDPRGVSKLMRRVTETTPLPYNTYTPTSSICPIHGYIAGEYLPVQHVEAIVKYGLGLLASSRC
jgi:ribonucleoside-triphosphate reductase